MTAGALTGGGAKIEDAVSGTSVSYDVLVNAVAVGMWCVGSDEKHCPDTWS